MLVACWMAAPPGPVPIPLYPTPNQPSVRIPAPDLPRVYTAADPDALARICESVETEVITLMRLPKKFVRGVTRPLQQLIAGGALELYPAATYYLIISKAQLGYDHSAAAERLAKDQASGALKKARNLPAKGGRR